MKNSLTPRLFAIGLLCVVFVMGYDHHERRNAPGKALEMLFASANGAVREPDIRLNQETYGLWEGVWEEEGWISPETSIHFELDITAGPRGFEYEASYQDVPYGPNSIQSAGSARFGGPYRAVDSATGHVFSLLVDPNDHHSRFIKVEVLDGSTGSLEWDADAGPETLGGRFIFRRSTYQAGFDCNKATTPVEVTICGDPLLARGDLEMNSLYSKLTKGAGVDAEAVRSDQREWVRQRNSSCQGDGVANASCLARMLADRLVALERLKNPSLGAGPRFDRNYALALLATEADLRENLPARLAMYPMVLSPSANLDWRADESGALYEQTYYDTKVVWPADIVFQYSDMFFVGAGGDVWTATHLAWPDSANFAENGWSAEDIPSSAKRNPSEYMSEYGWDIRRLEMDAGRGFLTVSSEAEGAIDVLEYICAESMARDVEPSVPWDEVRSATPPPVRAWLDRHPPEFMSGC